jgi:phosphopantetheine--protein transferase-like protein
LAKRCVGNDVVDLGDRPATTPRHRERFIQRVCSESERALLAARGSSDALLFSLFAAKEAAFKVICKLGPTPVFAHRKFEVSDDLSAVRYAEWTLSLRVDADAERVHAVAATFDPVPAGWVERMAEGADERAAARALLVREAGRALGLSPLTVERAPDASRWDGYGVPRLVHGGVALDVDVSLSHDGRFVACAFVV